MGRRYGIHGWPAWSAYSCVTKGSKWVLSHVCRWIYKLITARRSIRSRFEFRPVATICTPTSNAQWVDGHARSFLGKGRNANRLSLPVRTLKRHFLRLGKQCPDPLRQFHIPQGVVRHRSAVVHAEID